MALFVIGMIKLIIMEFILQLLAQLFGNVEDGINETSGIKHDQVEAAQNISGFESDREIEPLPQPNFFNGISFH